ncbi:ABC transporter substrate-binding protein [Saccharopolyspora sp. WRP15-2]|uniref:ABC transporter substrate-binding protein n=2 Tax=Saccharopolyspora TaxID=1835 RepID=A0ABT4UWX6_9PSEU|nr:ABC transporter substrate-binding protein [Saccharopolyspora oryzae]MDA3626179.1 ABC transporter substrate-binding protein [Saccharopolyspora oryzae]
MHIRSNDSTDPQSALARPNRRTVLRMAGASVLAAGASTLLSACGDGSSGSSATGTAAGAAPQPTPFRVATAPGDNYFIDAVNLDQQHYGKYNLEVPKFLHPSSGVQGMQLQTAGQIDGQMQDTLLTMTTFANSRPGDRPVIIGMRIPETTYSIVVNKGQWPSDSASFAEKMASLKGKTVGVTAIGAGADKQLRLALQQAGMSPGDITPLAVGQTTPAIAQMSAGKIDAYVGITFATARLMAAQTGGEVLVDFNTTGVPELLSKQQVDVLIAREDYAKSNADACKAWLAAQWEAKDWILANRDEAAELLNSDSFDGRGLDVSKQYIQHFAEDVVPKLQPQWKVTRDAIDLMIEVAVRTGAVQQGQISYETLVADFARA